MIRAALLSLLLPQLAFANDLTPVPYDDLRGQPHRIETFDALPRTPEPGIVFDFHWRATGLSIAEGLDGQGLVETQTEHGRFDTLTGLPSAPPHVASGAPDHNITVAHHAGFGSNALFPIGPAGVTEADGRGEGSVALAFDVPQFAFGFRLHAEYADPLGQRPAPQTAQLAVYDADARVLARFVLPLTHGVMSFAWRSSSGISALTLENTDPGGIALDDIVYNLVPVSG